MQYNARVMSCKYVVETRVEPEDIANIDKSAHNNLEYVARSFHVLNKVKVNVGLFFGQHLPVHYMLWLEFVCNNRSIKTPPLN
jgi:hypothetical protein